MLEQLRIKSMQSSSEERAKQLELLLRAVLDEGRSIGNTQEITYFNGHHWYKRRKSSGNAGVEWTDAMKVASRLLVDLSTLQTFFQAPSSSNVLDSDTTGKNKLLYNLVIFYYNIILKKLKVKRQEDNIIGL